MIDSKIINSIPEWVVKVSNALLDKWEIGESSRFCDDPQDWDSASVEEVAGLIWKEYQIHSNIRTE